MESKPRVLIVEDDSTWQTVYRDALTAAGYLVETAGDLATAMEVLDRRFFHVAVVDLKLSEDESNRDGLLVLRRIWALDETLVVVGSGFADVSMFDEFRQIGIFGFTEIPTEARKHLQAIDFYKGHVRKDEFFVSIMDKINKAVLEALSKSVSQKWLASPFAVLKDVSARDVQQLLGVGPMTELRPFLTSLIQPLFPWLQAKRDVVMIKDEHQRKVVAFEALCWSRDLGKPVVIRFGRRDTFHKLNDIAPVGSDGLDIEIQEEQSRKSSSHFEGVVYHVANIDFDRYFDPPPVKKS